MQKKIGLLLVIAACIALWFSLIGESQQDDALLPAQPIGTQNEGAKTSREQSSTRGDEVRTATLTTDDGTQSVALVAGRFVVMGDKYGLQNVVADLPELFKLAEQRDQIAVRTLLAALTTCDPSNSDVALTQEDYERKRSQIEAPDSVWSKDPPGREGKLRALAQLRGWCGDLTEEHFQKRSDLAAIGVELGMPEAVSRYERLAMPTDSWREGYEQRVSAHFQRTREIYAAQISRGNQNGLLYLGLMESDGRPGVPRDPSNALAHLLAFELAAGRASPQTLAGSRIQSLAQEITPEQRAEAERRAQQIFSRCCGT
jgi:hypothetical protein